MKDKDDSCSLEVLKVEYDKIKGKNNLPEFYELNKLFDIEDIDSDSDFLLRKIRRLISDRISAYSRFVDVILNPSNAPVFFLNVLKKLDLEDREKITKIYELLGNLELEMLALDLDYSEKKEADFIIKVFDVFNNQIRIGFLEVVEKLGNGKNTNKKDSKVSYFG